MNKKIIKMLNEPEESFENWAKKHNIVMSASGEKRKKKHTFQRWVLSAASAMLIFAAILPFVLNSANWAAPPIIPPANETPAPPIVETPIEAPKEKSYSANDVKNIKISLQDLLDVPRAVLFDTKLIIDCQNIYKDTPLENETINLAYIANSFLISDGESYAFFIDYRVRVYENYEFNGINMYNDMNNETNIENTHVTFKINETVEGKSIGYANFRIGIYDYYIKADGYDGFTELTEDSFLFLLQTILTTQTQI